MDENLNPHLDGCQPKQIIFMRHGKVGRFPTKDAVYDFLRQTKTSLRVFPFVYPLYTACRLENGYRHIDRLIKRYLNSESDYERLEYDKFMQLMLHEIDLPLAESENCIDLTALPTDIEVIYHSSTRRSSETAEFIQKRLGGRPRVDISLARELAEVRFSRTVVTRDEFRTLKGLAGCRDLVLERWYKGENAETLTESLERAEQLYNSLMAGSENTVLVVTHGWYLRLLYLFFYSRCKSPSYEELTNTKRMEYGESFQVFLEPAIVCNYKSTSSVRLFHIS